MMSSPSVMMLQLLVIASTVSVETIAKPDVHSVCVSGYNVELHCDANRPSSIRWMSRSIWSADEKTISIGHTVNKNLPDRHRYGFHSNDSRQLSISNVKLTDAGTFRCLEDDQDIVSIKLTVLAAEPSCSTNVSLKSINVSDVVQIHCQVDYTGRLHPAVNCHSEVGNKTPESTAPNKTGNSTFRRVEFMFNVVIDDVIHNTKFHCTTFFMSPDSTPLPYNYAWTSSTVTVYGMDPETTSCGTSNSSTNISDTQSSLSGARFILVIIVLVCIIVSLTVALVACGMVHVRERNRTGSRSVENRQSSFSGIHPVLVHDNIAFHQLINPSAAESHPCVSAIQSTSTNSTYENVPDPYERLQQSAAAEPQAPTVYAKLVNVKIDN